MKKLVMILAALLALLGAAVGIGGYAIFGGMMPVEPGANYGRATVIVTDGFVSMYLVDIGGGEFALVDAGIQPDAAAIKAELQKHDATAEDVVAILLTHGHGDHIGGGNAFPNADVYLHEADVDLASGKVAGKGPLSRMMTNDPGVKATKTVTDGQEITLGEATFRVYHTPGHTAGSVVYLLDDVLFLGDAGQIRADGELSPPPWVFTDDPAQAIDSMKRLAARIENDNVKLGTVVGSHAGPSKDPEVLRRFPVE